jgi:hypothetical protein
MVEREKEFVCVSCDQPTNGGLCSHCRSLGLQESPRELLEPDAEDIRLILHAVLPTCPCCNGTPTTFARYFPHSGIYQGYVHCSACDLQVFKNAYDRDDARSLAIAAWSRRPSHG